MTDTAYTPSVLAELEARAGASDRDREAEEWRPIRGWEGLYSVSDRGRIRSEERTTMTSHGVTRRVGGRVLIGSRHPAGYVQVRLQHQGRIEWVRMHRIVAETFIGEPTGPMVRHLDDDPTNNHVSNLVYGDGVENAHDKVRNGHYRNGSSHRDTCAHGHLYTPENTQITKEGYRACRTCKRAQGRAKYAAMKKVAA